MKIQTREIENFIKAPARAARVILIYGPDTGLMKERAALIGRTVVEDLQDPFNAVTLTSSQLAEDPARLLDEAQAMSMMGGDRLIRVQEASDKLTVQIKAYLEAPSESSVIVLEAGDLGPRSSLRKACEASSYAAALPCYVEDERDVSRFVRQFVAEQGYQMDPDALSWLAAQLQGDRMRVRSELEKLTLYKGTQDGSRITLDDALAICGASGAATLDDCLHAVGLGQAEKALRSWMKLTEEGVSFIVILRSLQTHFKRLHHARSLIEDHRQAPDQAMKALSPPVFFKIQASFKAQLQRWRLSALHKALERLMTLEAECKQTGAPVETLCAQMILALSKVKSH